MGLIARSPLPREQLIEKFAGPESTTPFTLVRTLPGQGEYIAHHAQGEPGERVLRAAYAGEAPKEVVGSTCHTEDHDGRHIVFSWFKMAFPCVVVEPYRKWVWVVDGEDESTEEGE